MPARERHEFGPFVLDVTERRLTREGYAVMLAPKAFDLLSVLVRKAGRLVTKSELLDTVWTSSFVEEGVLAAHVTTIRKTLGDSRHPMFIETVSGSGYRFIAPVRTVAESTMPNGADRELVGRGRFHLLSASRAEVPKALAAFRELAERDPAYAAAHAGVALACCAQAELRLAPPSEAYEHARTAALRALAMDPACADAQVALGVVLFLCDWNWLAAERCLQRALQLNPQHTEEYVLDGRLLDTLGRHDQALAAN